MSIRSCRRRGSRAASSTIARIEDFTSRRSRQQISVTDRGGGLVLARISALQSIGPRKAIDNSGRVPRCTRKCTSAFFWRFGKSLFCLVGAPRFELGTPLQPTNSGAASPRNALKYLEFQLFLSPFVT